MKNTCAEFTPLVNGGDYRGSICCVCGEKESAHRLAARGKKHIAKESDQLLMRSMGKTFRILAIFDNDQDANAHMAKHDNLACIAQFGPFVFLADKYDAGTA